MHSSRIPARFWKLESKKTCVFSVEFKTTYKKCKLLAFLLVLAEWNLKKCDSLAFPLVFAHYTCFELQLVDF